MAENPGNGDAVWRGVVFLSQAVQDLVELRIFFASDEDSLKHAVLEGGPCLDRDVFQAAVFENAAVPVTARVVLDIDVEACVNGGAMSYGKLDLVDLNRSFCGLIQKLDLHGIVVAHTESPNLSLGFQRIESLCHLFRLHESVRTMKKQKIHILGVQPFQAAVHRFQDMLPGKIVADARTDRAFRLDHHLFPEGRCQDLSKGCFRLSSCINIRVIEEIDAVFQSCVHNGPDLIVGLSLGQTHTA